MIESFLIYLSIGTIIGITSLSGGYSGGRVGAASLQAIETQPQAAGSIMKLSIIALALIETSALLGLLLAFFMLSKNADIPHNWATIIAQWAVVFACGIPGCAVALASARPALRAITATARQPFFSSNILTLLLLSLSLIQTPVILGFLIALIIIQNLTASLSILAALNYLAAATALGISSIGTAAALARFSEKICWGLGVNRSGYSSLFSFSFVSQAIIETPLIFALLISLIISRSPATSLGVIKSFAAALCIGIGTITPSLSSANAAKTAAHYIILNPYQAGTLGRLSTVTQALIDAIAIYALLISLGILLL